MNDGYRGIKEFSKINEYDDFPGDEKKTGTDDEHEKSEIIVAVNKPEKEARKKTKKTINKSFIVAIMGIACGVVILALGFITYESNLRTYKARTGPESTSYTSYEYYGGDAYTGIQQAAADASNNAGVVAENIVTTNTYLMAILNSIYRPVGLVLIALGLITICNYLYKLTEIRERRKKEKEAEPKESNVTATAL